MVRRTAAKSSSSTPTSIRTRRRTSVTCAMRRSGTRLSAFCRATGRAVEVQNYIDNTGVQVADVIVGFRYLEKKVPGGSARADRGQTRKFDYYCWDLYARVSSFYEAKIPSTPCAARR